MEDLLYLVAAAKAVLDNIGRIAVANYHIKFLKKKELSTICISLCDATSNFKRILLATYILLGYQKSTYDGTNIKFCSPHHRPSTQKIATADRRLQLRLTQLPITQH